MSGMLGGRDNERSKRGSGLSSQSEFRSERIGVGEVGLDDRLNIDERARGINRVASARPSLVN
jgi:hypothetical protein